MLGFDDLVFVFNPSLAGRDWDLRARIMLAAIAGNELKEAFRDATNERDKAIIHNLYHDDRISEQRANDFLSFCPEPRDANSFLDGLEEYHWTRVRRLSDARKPDFAFNDASSNNLNFCDPNATVGNSYLGRIFNFGSKKLAEPLRDVVEAYRASSLPSSRMPDEPIKIRLREEIEQLSSDKLPAFLRAVRTLHPASDNEVHSFDNCDYTERIRSLMEESADDQSSTCDVAFSVIHLLSIRHRIEPFEPTWAFPWEELRQIVLEKQGKSIEELSPEEWCESVGICAAPGDWIAIMKYPFKASNRLIRPTQLDAGRHSFHFPSPMSVSTPCCGHPVWLAHPPDSAKTFLLQEYIHQTLPVQPEDVVAVKKIHRKTPSQSGSLKQWRKEHWLAMQKKFADLESWMHDANEI
jgi:hypothetical protein